MDLLKYMSITIVDYSGSNPFEEHPQLKSIWPKELYDLAVAGVTESLDIIGEYEIGNIYLIKENDEIVGLTGFYPYEGLGPRGSFAYEDVKHLGLRWHGVIPERRGNGISSAAFSLMLEQAGIKFPNAKRIVEIVPDHENAGIIRRHFEKLGFQKDDTPPKKYDWSEYSWQGYTFPIKPEPKPAIKM